ncbi:SDR family NAD(P)-dependent oxidoreductase [Paenibacillus tundrae]|uniref:NAD(P)-dependent dehydrogenase (Short-subunit alcohol dehydrogenase family) n=1 Tax=Paenibacillus tundrae TaxID=528187 RepID=A0ABT9W920_9BACL|nr:glucose 1-dehydrogenase [Paenibacillus tundrae]MDQ0169549.1 NAD(P)-dependent dehydrogenase (short-subunit alcohol dehydrogenase family) [Paenibacillus tundrae]
MNMPEFHLEGQTALVTGAGRGIGKAIAIGLAESGSDVVLVSRTFSEIEETAAYIQEHTGRRAIALTADVTSREQLEETFREAIAAMGRLDILVNNAGMNIRTPALEVTDEQWETIMQTNLKSAFMASQIAGQHMKDQGGGKIVNISSVGGHTALRTGVVYGSTKAAMIHMTKVLAMEWGKYGIRVNAVGPWYFRTPLTEKLLNDPKYLGEIIDRTPLQRVGELHEVVGPVIFLASDAAGYITGQTLLVDGGMSIYGF